MTEPEAIEAVTREQVGKFQGNFTPMPITQRVDDSLLHVSHPNRTMGVKGE